MENVLEATSQREPVAEFWGVLADFPHNEKPPLPEGCRLSAWDFDAETGRFLSGRDNHGSTWTLDRHNRLWRRAPRAPRAPVEACRDERGAFLRRLLARAFAQVPEWSFARVGAPQFARSVHRVFRQFAEAYRLDRSTLLCGNTGDGKTAATVAALHRFAEEVLARALEQPPQRPPPAELEQLYELVWTTGYELARARAIHPFGRGEPELLVRLARSPLLVLDEIGTEPFGPEVFEVLDAAYERGAVVVVTSGLTRKAFRDRYGDAAFRRIAERGAVLESFGAAGAR